MNFTRITLTLCMLGSVFSILPGCQPKTSSSELLADTASIQKGQAIFSQQCAACHNFRQDGIGPQLGGLTATASPEWIERFIRDPKLMIESGDERAHQIFEKYKTIMPRSEEHTSELQSPCNLVCR